MRKLVIFILLFFLSSFSFAFEVPDLSELIEFNISDYLSSLGEQDSDSKRLNSLGFTAYKEGNLYKAAQLWRCAVDRNEQNAWAHYNLACALSLIAKAIGRDPSTIVYDIEYGDPEVDKLFEYTNTIFYHLKRAVYYDTKIWHRMQEDSDLDLIRNMITYKYILLYPENNPLKLLEIINQWYLPSHGVYPGGSVTFKNNTITMEGLVFNDRCEPKTIIKKGHFTQQGNQLTIFIEHPESRQFDGKLSIKYDELGFILYFNLIIDGQSYNSTPDYGA